MRRSASGKRAFSSGQGRGGAEPSARAASLVAEVRTDLGVSRRIFARLTGYSERAIAGWEAGGSLSEPSRQRMLEMHRLQEALARVIRAGRIAEWLDRPNEAFGGLKPLEVIERGEIDRLWRMVFELESGVAS
jgi:transcriptional regulator with XRE-family HTH domain